MRNLLHYHQCKPVEAASEAKKKKKKIYVNATLWRAHYLIIMTQNETPEQGCGVCGTMSQ